MALISPWPVGSLSPETKTKVQMVAHLRDLVVRVRHANSFMPREVSNEVRELDAAITAVEEDHGRLIDDMMATRYASFRSQQRRAAGTVGQRPAPLTPDEERRRNQARNQARAERERAEQPWGRQDVHAGHAKAYGKSFEWCQHPDCVLQRRPVLHGVGQ